MATSPFLNILLHFLMHVGTGSAYMHGSFGDLFKDATRVLFGK